VNKGRNRQHHAALEAALLAMTGAFTAYQLHAYALVSRPTLSLTTVYCGIHRWQREQRLHPAGTRYGEQARRIGFELADEPSGLYPAYAEFAAKNHENAVSFSHG
jgi:Fe2+ or Zn2+ uptake regulation protein